VGALEVVVVEQVVTGVHPSQQQPDGEEVSLSPSSHSFADDIEEATPALVADTSAGGKLLRPWTVSANIQTIGEPPKKSCKLQLLTQDGLETNLLPPKLLMTGELPLLLLKPRSPTIGEPPLPPRLNPLLQLELPPEFTLADSPCLVVKGLLRSTSPPLESRLKVQLPGRFHPTWLRNQTVMVMVTVVLLRG